VHPGWRNAGSRRSREADLDWGGMPWGVLVFLTVPPSQARFYRVILRIYPSQKPYPQRSSVAWPSQSEGRKLEAKRPSTSCTNGQPPLNVPMR